MINISILIPMYNEEFRIKNTLIDIYKYIISKENIYINDYEIILIDDGSIDKTLLAVDSLREDSDIYKNIKIIKLNQNCGKGMAIKTGVMNANMDYVLYLDADGAVKISEIEKIAPFIDINDIVFGSRKLHKFNYGFDIYKNIRHIISLTGSLLNKTLISDVYDTQCPFKLIKTDIAKSIFKKMKINRYAFDLELLFLAQKKGLSTKEISVSYLDKNGSKFNIIRDTYNTFIDFTKIHFNNLFGIYK